jgi:ketosteroid isomerase-like protein
MKMLYEKMKIANKNKDIDAFMELVHEDFVFVRNQNGTDANRSEFYEMGKMMYASDKFTREKERCIYENDDIIVEHLVMSFPDESKEAIMGVWTKKDGKLICYENEGTPIK